MKVVFSRKGFDSTYGGMPSPILPNGQLISLPIPSRVDADTLGDLNYPGIDTAVLVRDLSRGRYVAETRVHLDPDLERSHSRRLPGWRPALGQTGSAQSHLDSHGVGPGDVFLFFGWFRQVDRVGNRWRFVPGAPNLHVLFGWLEVAQVLPVVADRENSLRQHPWIANHPHVASPDWYDDRRNTLYVARERSQFSPTAIFGGGRFPNFSPALQLTKPGSTRSVWSLPSWFLPENRVPLSYHGDQARWQVDGSWVTLQSVAKGQEFVIDGDQYPDLAPWVDSIISENG